MRKPFPSNVSLIENIKEILFLFNMTQTYNPKDGKFTHHKPTSNVIRIYQKKKGRKPKSDYLLYNSPNVPPHNLFLNKPSAHW